MNALYYEIQISLLEYVKDMNVYAIMMNKNDNHEYG